MKSIHLLVHHIKRDYRALLLSSTIRHNFQQYVPVRYIKSFKMPRSMHELNMQRVRQKIIARSTKHSDNTNVSLQVNITCVTD